MRVAVVIDSMNWGGAEMLLAEFAAAAPAAGLDVHVTYLFDLNGSPAAPRLRALGVPVEHVPATRLHDPRGLIALRAQLRRVRPDVVHTHLGYSDLLGCPAARSLGIPAISTLHLMDFGAEPRKERLMALARRGGARRVVCVSEAARAAYLATGWDRPERVVCVHNGVAARAPSPGARERIRRALGIAGSDRVVTMVTVLREGKGHDVAAGAVARLGAGSRLLVLGDGPARPGIERMLAPLGDRAVLAGHRDDVPDVLAASDVLLHPTRVDAFPTALLEAMAAGLPVVATRVGGIPEIVEDGVTGLLVDAPARPDAIATALEAVDPAMGERGRERYEDQFTAERWVSRLRVRYEEVLP